MTIRNIALLALLALAGVSASAEPLRAREWFVRAGSEGGDGTQAKPFADPWMALEKSEAGDVIHVTGGKYYGKLSQGIWEVPFDNIQLLGGYDPEFKTRDPWTNRTELKWDEKSKNWPNQARLKGLNCKGCVVDGITIDMKDSAKYTDETKTSRKDTPGIPDNAIEFNHPVTVRNCVIVNPAGSAIHAVGGSTIENNLIVNALIFGVQINGTEPAVVRNNTMLFGWGFKEPGKGAYDGAFIKVNAPMTITNNIFAHSDSNSLYQPFTKMDKVSITKNVFHQNLYSNLFTFVESKSLFIDDKNMGDLEELGLKAFEGNEVLNPEMAYDPAWLDLYSKRTAYVPGKVTMDDMNKLRQLAGLPVIAKGGTPALGVAPAYDLDKAMNLMAPKNEKCKAGARKIPLESKVTGGAAAAPAKAYPKSALLDWHKSA
ncbi:MAG: right-handed parallel beta-helix repeat-containing protein, partial [Planctomycetota bacterium]